MRPVWSRSCLTLHSCLGLLRSACSRCPRATRLLSLMCLRWLCLLPCTTRTPCNKLLAHVRFRCTIPLHHLCGLAGTWPRFGCLCPLVELPPWLHRRRHCRRQTLLLQLLPRLLPNTPICASTRWGLPAPGLLTAPLLDSSLFVWFIRLFLSSLLFCLALCVEKLCRVVVYVVLSAGLSLSLLFSWPSLFLSSLWPQGLFIFFWGECFVSLSRSRSCVAFFFSLEPGTLSSLLLLYYFSSSFLSRAEPHFFKQHDCSQQYCAQK